MYLRSCLEFPKTATASRVFVWHSFTVNATLSRSCTMFLCRSLDAITKALFWVYAVREQSSVQGNRCSRQRERERRRGIQHKCCRISCQAKVVEAMHRRTYRRRRSLLITSPFLTRNRVEKSVHVFDAICATFGPVTDMDNNSCRGCNQAVI